MYILKFFLSRLEDLKFKSTWVDYFDQFMMD